MYLELKNLLLKCLFLKLYNVHAAFQTSFGYFVKASLVMQQATKTITEGTFEKESNKTAVLVLPLTPIKIRCKIIKNCKINGKYYLYSVKICL